MQVMEYLIEAGSDVNHCDKKRTTPLMALAAQAKDLAGKDALAPCELWHVIMVVINDNMPIYSVDFLW